jgi:ankyrin repeat protein
LTIAEERHHTATVTLLRKVIDKGGELLSDASRGDRAKLEELRAAGVSVDYRDPNGSTALMHAAKAGQKEITDVLIAANADRPRATTARWR